MIRGDSGTNQQIGIRSIVMIHHARNANRPFNDLFCEFMEYRPYVSIQQFRQEMGKYVDAAQVATYEQYVYVPVNVNESDAATIMQIAGVDQAAADGLIAACPFDSTAAFLTKLAELAPTVDQAAAESYLEMRLF